MEKKQKSPLIVQDLVEPYGASGILSSVVRIILLNINEVYETHLQEDSSSKQYHDWYMEQYDKLTLLESLTYSQLLDVFQYASADVQKILQAIQIKCTLAIGSQGYQELVDEIMAIDTSCYTTQHEEINLKPHPWAVYLFIAKTYTIKE